MSGEEGIPPGKDAPTEEKLLFLQEQAVGFVTKYNVPLIEVSLVISKYIRILVESLEVAAEEYGESLPDEVFRSSGPNSPLGESNISMDLEKVLGMVDHDRMDILDTILRVVMTETQLPNFTALGFLREWEGLVRNQLAKVESPGQLFSPFEFPEGF